MAIRPYIPLTGFKAEQPVRHHSSRVFVPLVPVDTVVPPNSWNYIADIDLMLNNLWGFIQRSVGPAIVADTGPALSVNNTSFLFSEAITVGTNSETRQLIIQNTGSGTLSLSSISVAGDFSFVGFAGTTASMSSGASTTINVRFTPTASGVRTGSITFISNVAGSPHTIALSGTGIAIPVPPLVPIISSNFSVLNYGQLVVDTNTELVVQVSNTGTGILNITEITASSPFILASVD